MNNQEIIKNLENETMEILKVMDKERCHTYLQELTTIDGKTQMVAKDFTRYKNLLLCLRQLIDTHINLNREINNINYDYINELTSKLELEIDVINDLKQESLKKEYLEQYKCLVNCYVKILDLNGKINREYFMRKMNDEKDENGLYTSTGLNTGRPLVNPEYSKKHCPSCLTDKRENEFYFKPNGDRMDICKECIKNNIASEGFKAVYDVLRTNDIPYMYEMWILAKSNKENKPLNVIFAEYLRLISWLPRCKELKFKNSDFDAFIQELLNRYKIEEMSKAQVKLNAIGEDSIIINEIEIKNCKVDNITFFTDGIDNVIKGYYRIKVIIPKYVGIERNQMLEYKGTKYIVASIDDNEEGKVTVVANKLN